MTVSDLDLAVPRAAVTALTALQLQKLRREYPTSAFSGDPVPIVLVSQLYTMLSNGTHCDRDLVSSAQ